MALCSNSFLQTQQILMHQKFVTPLLKDCYAREWHCVFKKFGQVAMAQYLEMVPSLVFHPILHTLLIYSYN